MSSLAGSGQLAWLSPAELARVRHLARPDQDPDDVPSAVLALLLEAFLLSEDSKKLRAVYGDAYPAGWHREWVSILKAGGDADVASQGRTSTRSSLAWPRLSSCTRKSSTIRPGTSRRLR